MMMRKARLAAGAALLLIGMPMAASATSHILFGPKTYVIGTSGPLVAHEEFVSDAATLCSGRAAFVLSVRNGDENGANAISSGRILVNGVKLVSENDFQLRTAGIERAFAASARTNSIDVTLASVPGGSVTVTIFREIEEPLFPAFEHILGQNGQSVYPHQFEGTNTGAPLVLVVENGLPDGSRRIMTGSVTLNGTMVLTNNELNEGMPLLRRRITLRPQNDLRIEAVGRQLDSLRVSVKRLLDESACAQLRVAFTAPDAGSVINTQLIAARGIAVGPRDIGVTLNGSVADIDLSRAGTESDPFTWHAVVSAEPGVVELQAVVTDSRRLRASATRSVMFAPPAEFIMLRPSARSGPAPFKVTFAVTSRFDAGVVRWELDLDGDGVFELSSPQLPDDITHTYVTGAHTPSARVILVDGLVLTDIESLLAH